ncbi:MAG: NAD(P)H-hydrate dehydratase [Candidatus Hermodarchaeota archaeon]
MDKFNSEKVSSEEIALLDNNSEWLGIPKSFLMECAGYSFTMELINKYNLKENKESKVAIFCGTGNNGGDGFVIARHLSSHDIKVLVILLGSPDNIRTKEAKLNWNIISQNLNYSIRTEIIKDSTDIGKIGMLIEEDKSYNIIIDGLLGTGIKGRIREPISTAIDLINTFKEEKSKRFKVVSIDVPSGMDPNTGEISDKAVKSDLVITFHRVKKGMEVDNEFIGEIVVKSIGIPQEAKILVGKGDIIPTLKVRKIDNHKGQFGRVFVVGGSKNYSGAPAYTSLTGINFGCDLVITYVPQIIGDVLRIYSPNMIVRTNPGDWLDLEAKEEILELIEWSDAIVIGPGLGLKEQTEDLLIELLKFLKEKKKSFVLDADALKLVKNHLNLIKGQSVILTPHEGELKIMTGVELPPYNKIEERSDIIFNLAKKLNLTLLVKGPYDYISNGKQIKLNRTGCPEMSIGGTGDVLAGLCACFLTTENDAFQSACSAAFINGYLGEYCKEKIGPRFTAMDMIENINNSILALFKKD